MHCQLFVGWISVCNYQKMCAILLAMWYSGVLPFRHSILKVFSNKFSISLNRMTVEMVRMSQIHAETLNVNRASFSVKTTNVLIQLKFVMDKINVVIIRKRAPIANDSSVLRNTSNAAHLPIEQHFVLKTHNDAMEFRYNIFHVFFLSILINKIEWKIKLFCFIGLSKQRRWIRLCTSRMHQR